jgi:transposase InsO family protein
MYMAYSNNPHLPRLRMEAVRMVRSGWSIRKVARHFGFHHTAVMRWVKKDRVWGLHGWRPIPTESSKPHSHPKILKPSMVAAIIAQRKKRGRCAVIVHQELMNQGISVSLSSVRRTLERNGLIKRRSPWKRWHFSLPRPEAKNPGDLVQIDTIHVGPTGDGRFYVYTIIDLASRWAFAWTTPKINTHMSARFVRMAQHAAPFHFRMMQSDHGSEFSSWFTERIGVSGISHRHIRVRQSNDNAHIERFNRTLQEECLNKMPRDIRAYQRAIREYLPYYNAERLHFGINFMTPFQRLKVVPSY